MAHNEDADPRQGDDSAAIGGVAGQVIGESLDRRQSAPEQPEVRDLDEQEKEE